MAPTPDISLGHGGSRTSREVGAAAAVVGGAAIAGKLVWDKRVDAERKAERAFRLHQRLRRRPRQIGQR